MSDTPTAVGVLVNMGLPPELELREAMPDIVIGIDERLKAATGPVKIITIDSPFDNFEIIFSEGPRREQRMAATLLDVYWWLVKLYDEGQEAIVKMREEAMDREVASVTAQFRGNRPPAEDRTLKDIIDKMQHGGEVLTELVARFAGYVYEDIDDGGKSFDRTVRRLGVCTMIEKTLDRVADTDDHPIEGDDIDNTDESGAYKEPAMAGDCGV